MLSSILEKADVLNKLDKFPNSGRTYILEKGTSSEKVVADVIKDLIDSATQPKTPDSPITEKKHSEKAIKSTDESGLTFYVLGCGEHDPATKKVVAELMNEIARGEKKKPDFIVLLGDNFEECGVDSANSESFVKGFDQVYHVKELENICGIPCFVIPGNHDHGFPVRYFSLLKPYRITGVNNNLEKISREILHTVADKKGGIDLKKAQLYEQKHLDLAELKSKEQTWNMPGRYYALQCGDNKQLFCIDSNTYVKEYIEYYIKGNKDFNKQPAWLAEVAKKPETLKFLFLHHSLHTVGKRSGCGDVDEYLSAEDISLLIKHGIITKEEAAEVSYNEILRRLLQKQGLEFDTVFAAHDHAMYHYNNQSEVEAKSKSADSEKKGAKTQPVLRQVVAGGAGGDLQNRFSFDKSTPCFIRRHGFVKVTLPSQKDQNVTIDYYTVADPELKKIGIKGHHLRFNHNDVNPLKDAKTSDEEGVKELKELVITVCKTYLKANRPPIKVGYIPYYDKEAGSLGWAKKVIDSVPDDAFFADDLQNHFNRFEANTFEMSIRYLNYALSKSPALLQLFQNELMKKYTVSFDQFQTMTMVALKTLFISPPKISKAIPSPIKVKEEREKKEVGKTGLLASLLGRILPGSNSHENDKVQSSPKSQPKISGSPGLKPIAMGGLFSSTKPVLIEELKAHPLLHARKMSSPMSIPARPTLSIGVPRCLWRKELNLKSEEL